MTIETKIGNQTPEPKTKEDLLAKQLLSDIVWEQITKLKGWAKTKAFIERVFNKPKNENN